MKDLMKDLKIGAINYSYGNYLKGHFYLDHSCDEWVIGNLEEAKKFSNNLLEAIKQVEATQ